MTDGDDKGDGNTRQRAMKSMMLAIARRATAMMMIESQRAKTLTMTILGQQIMYQINPDLCAVNNNKGCHRCTQKLHTNNWRFGLFYFNEKWETLIKFSQNILIPERETIINVVVTVFKNFTPTIGDLVSFATFA